MSRERELLKVALDFLDPRRWLYPSDQRVLNIISRDIELLLAQPEQEPVTDKPTETAMAVMPNGVRVSNVYDAYEEGRKSVMVEQEPEAWIVHNKVTGVKTQVAYKPADCSWDIIEVIPLYTAPPKREPLGEEEMSEAFMQDDYGKWDIKSFVNGIRFAEKEHGIGGGK